MLRAAAGATCPLLLKESCSVGCPTLSPMKLADALALPLGRAAFLTPDAEAQLVGPGGALASQLAALSDGGFVVTWEGPDGDANGIYGRRFGADGGARDAHEFSVSQERAGDQSTPDVTALANGGFATAWVDASAAGGLGRSIGCGHD